MNKKQEPISYDVRQLPVIIYVTDLNGKPMPYVLKSAKQGFGAILNKEKNHN